VVEALGLKGGDDIVVQAAGKRSLEIEKTLVCGTEPDWSRSKKRSANAAIVRDDHFIVMRPQALKVFGRHPG
jgi:hypothetical protein